MIVVYILIAIFASVFIIAAIMPGHYKIEKDIIVNATPDKAYGKVADFKNYRDWNPWHKMEPTAKTTITGTPGTPGHKYEWEGKKIGVGNLVMREVKAPNIINIDLEFIKPWKSKANDNWKFEKVGEAQTKISWSNDGPLAYPVARLMGPMINKNLNQQFEQGLKDLKELCEK